MLTALCWAVIGLFLLGIVGASDQLSYGYQTQTAGTRINQLVQGKADHYTYVTKLTYQAGSTAHSLALMRKVSETTLSAAAAASQAVINLTADPGTGTNPGAIAAGDHVAIKRPDGRWHHGVVSSVASLAITLTANVPTGGLASGARVIFYGAPGDTDHTERTYNAPASATTTFPAVGDGVLCRSLGVDEPVIFSSDNASNAGFLRHLAAEFSRGAC